MPIVGSINWKPILHTSVYSLVNNIGRRFQLQARTKTAISATTLYNYIKKIKRPDHVQLHCKAKTLKI